MIHQVFLDLGLNFLGDESIAQQAILATQN